MGDKMYEMYIILSVGALRQSKGDIIIYHWEVEESTSEADKIQVPPQRCRSNSSLPPELLVRFLYPYEIRYPTPKKPGNSVHSKFVSPPGTRMLHVCPPNSSDPLH